MEASVVANSLSNPMACVIIFFGVFFLILAIVTKNVVLSRWHHTFDKAQFSSQGFFENLEAAIKERDIPRLGDRRVTHKEVVLVGASREYLRIYRGGHAFEICAATVGKSMYVSWWFFEKQTFMRRLMMKIPIVRWFLMAKTYHQVDAEEAFEDLIHFCVLESVDAMTGTKGSTLSEAERSVINLRKGLIQG